VVKALALHSQGDSDQADELQLNTASELRDTLSHTMSVNNRTDFPQEKGYNLWQMFKNKKMRLKYSCSASTVASAIVLRMSTDRLTFWGSRISLIVERLLSLKKGGENVKFEARTAPG
jgi:hypothetical protein